MSSDAYAGRLPGTPGEDKSVAYIISQCQKLGLGAGAPDGGWIQKVPLWGTHSKGVLQLAGTGKPVSLKAGEDYVAWPVLPDEKVSVAASE